MGQVQIVGLDWGLCLHRWHITWRVDYMQFLLLALSLFITLCPLAATTAIAVGTYEVISWQEMQRVRVLKDLVD